MPTQQDTGRSGGWFRRLFGRRRAADLDPERDDLIVVASSFDDAEAASVALLRAQESEPAWTPDRPAVLRHHLLLPAGTVDDAIAVAAQDGYAPPTGSTPAVPADTPPPDREIADGAQLTLQRVQVLDALHCSQERSRMAGLAQRRGGIVLGWDALQPPPSR